MQRVPFISPLSIGTDILQLTRLNPLLVNPDGTCRTRFARRILHPLEQKELQTRHPAWHEGSRPGQQSLKLIAQWMGGRWAAKEAARKAVGATVLGWKDVRVERDELTGRPTILWKLERGSSPNVEHEGRLSISHDGDYVVATVLAVPFPSDPPTANIEQFNGK